MTLAENCAGKHRVPNNTQLVRQPFSNAVSPTRPNEWSNCDEFFMQLR